MRSAVPLGGLGTGSVELRADGRFREWLVENEGPGLNEHGKIPVKDEMLLGLKVNGVAKLLSTHPPLVSPLESAQQSPTTPSMSSTGQQRLAGVEAMRYAGAFPVSKLDLEDSSFPIQASRPCLFELRGMERRGLGGAEHLVDIAAREHVKQEGDSKLRHASPPHARKGSEQDRASNCHHPCRACSGQLSPATSSASCGRPR